MKLKIVFLLLVLFVNENNTFEIDRVIVSSDTNPDYLDFWPIVAKAWIKLGIKPTLALIADNSVQVDESLGDVIRFEPIKGVPDALYAQTVRLLVPILFENEICLISDVDMIPLSRTYYKDSVSAIPDDKFVVYRNILPTHYKMCYNAAKGRTFQEVFGITEAHEIPFLIKQWASKNMGWNTDELMLYTYLNNWKAFKTRCIRLNHKEIKRIDRNRWNYNQLLFKQNYYIDCHSIRPYKKYKREIDELMNLLDVY